MPTECLILRRDFPVPVTFADLRRAATEFGPLKPRATGNPKRYIAAEPLMTWWHAAIKEATGAIDAVYAVIDGREVRVSTIIEGERGLIKQMWHDSPRMNERINDLLDEAGRAGYWQRPHEVRHTLEESMMSHKTMARIAVNSIIVAGGK